MRTHESRLAHVVAKLMAAPVAILLLTGSSDCDEEWRDSPQPEHGQKWVGAYDGAADVYWCSTGTEEGSVAAFLDIRRMEGSRVQVALTVVSGAEYLFGADAMLTADRSSRLVGRRQYGNMIDAFSLSLHGDVITGTVRKLKQTTQGTEYCTTETTLNVRRSTEPLATFLASVASRW